ncbi:TIGR02281 family clan AA aspartic protease [Sedimenticola selenatireducens]|uniref:TIGR02281 family clan AA aspartic protease n=1 Tax=Sedimenticola selenatireducens TaxID=191960 RepID=UPI002AAA93C4|nr:TIGR02281 family clan AA aspartic protease [Sedimenticola selenatireducens]
MTRLPSKRHFAILLLFPGCLLWSASVLAVEKVRVMALFADKAMLQIDGKQRLLRAGQKSPEGVLLVSADANGAVIEVNGKRDSYSLGSQVGGHFAQRQMAEVKIWADNRGSYNTMGSINGRMVDMLVDTGATTIAMSEVEAKRLGIPYRIRGEKTGVRTASGFAKAYAITLDQVQVGELVLQQVEAVVVEGNSPHRVLLGMSFLSRVKMEHKGTLMVLQSKF